MRRHGKWTRAWCAVAAMLLLCGCGAPPPPRYATVGDLNRESCVQGIKPGKGTEAELVDALRGCKSVTKVDAPFAQKGTQSTLHGWQLAGGRAGSAEAAGGVVLVKRFALG